MMTAAGPIDVTDREWEIMQLMLQRRTTREIADALFVSVGTVRSHVAALVHKVGAVDRDDLIAIVERAQRAR
jgi:DNA-binding CsgD family transcriptional regulator